MNSPSMICDSGVTAGARNASRMKSVDPGSLARSALPRLNEQFSLSCQFLYEPFRRRQ
jgi:hypothetical protein